MSRGTDNSRLARQLLDDEFEAPTRGNGLGCLSWLGIGGLFATVFLFCGGLGALAAGRELWVQSRAAQDGRAGLEPSPLPVEQPVEPPAPPPDPDPPPGAGTPDEPPERVPEPVVTEPEPAFTTRARPAPAPSIDKPDPVAPQPVAPTPRPTSGRDDGADQPAPEDEMDVQTNDLIDPWGEKGED